MLLTWRELGHDLHREATLLGKVSISDQFDVSVCEELWGRSMILP